VIDLKKEDIDETEGSGTRKISKSWVDSVRYSKFIIKKKTREEEYQSLMLLLGLKKTYTNNKFDIKQLTIVSPDLIRIVHEKKERLKNKSVIKRRTIEIKKKVNRDSILSIEEIISKYKNNEELTKDEKKRLDMYIMRKEFEEKYKNKELNEKNVSLGTR